ncbi:dihydrolipoyl dehydrogenase family protein [Alkalibacterium sp. f15]|uniref:dihydrolipoyl dehydrogenase family protein n=1 Tax=Alkalibacterium sp. f15 TaxID=3414029 RepID=UPI003BF78046
MKNTYDVVVIGSGVAGKSTAFGLASAGKKVAIVEADLWGGTCPNRGCDPKKVLVSAVEVRNKAMHLMGKGITKVPEIDWPDLMAFKKTFTDPVPEQSKESLKSAGIETYTGTAKFVDQLTIQVNDDLLEADRFVIATGARPNLLDITGYEHFLTSDDFLSLPEMPDTVTFIGAGYIAFEFAAIANAAGADVHVIQHNNQPLREYDQEFVKEVMTQLEAKGVTFHLNTGVTKIEKQSTGYVLTDNNGFQLATNLVFGTTGRIPNTDNLNLDKVKVEYDKRGVKVDNRLQTSNPSIFAIGDVLSKEQPKLTPVSSLEASYLVSLLTEKTTEPLSYPSVPSIVFSSPKLAQVGVTVEEAKNNKNKYDISDLDATTWFSYRRTNEPVSKAKMIIDKESGLLMGATCLNDEADELINYFSLLIDRKITATDLADMVFAYPAIASDIPYFYS